MHIILKNHTNELSVDFEHQDIGESKKFEMFCNYCCVSKHFLGRFDPLDVTTDEDDASIDGIAIIIDGDLVRTPDDALEIFKTHKTNLSAEIVITQAKTGESFKKDEISNFKMGIEDYLSLDPRLPNGKLNKESIEIFKILLNNLNKIKGRRPNVYVYYCTTGVYGGEREIKASFEIIERYITASEFFNAVSVKPMGRGEILKLYAELTEKMRRSCELLITLECQKCPAFLNLM